MDSKLSVLQKYILEELFDHGDKLHKKDLLKFYDDKEDKPSKEDQYNILTKSIDRLIDRGLVVGFGKRTEEKMFIKRMYLSESGINVVLKIRRSTQRTLF